MKFRAESHYNEGNKDNYDTQENYGDGVCVCEGGGGSGVSRRDYKVQIKIKLFS